MNKEEVMLQKRLIELSNLSYKRDIVTFSDFLNLNELNILHTTPKDLFPSRYETENLPRNFPTEIFWVESCIWE